MFGRFGLAHRLRSLFLRRRTERELDEELRFHLDRQIEELVRQGMGREEAERAALRGFGGVEQVKEACRDERGTRPLEDLWQDLVYGLRILRKSPVFTAVALLTLALGIGANTAVFSVVDGVLLRRLPFPDSDRIVTLWNTYPRLSDQKEEVSPPDFCDWHDRNRSLAQLAAYERFFWVLDGDPAPVRLRAARVSGEFFAALRVRPALGRPLFPTDDHEGSHHVAVLSHRLWTSRFGADPSVVGRTLSLTGVGHTVVGVMPAGFDFPGRVDLWTPLAYEPPFEPNLRRSTWLRTVARLEPGVTLAQAQADLSSVARQLEEQYPDSNEGRGVVVVPLLEQTVGDVRSALLVLLGAVGFLLLIACANLVNLLLSRGTLRLHEIGLRVAMGAGRTRLLRQLLTESLLLGLAGGSGGLLMASSCLSLVRRLAPGSVPRLEEVGLDFRVLGFAFIVSLAAAVLSGLGPALMAAREDPLRILKEGGSRASDIPRRRRFRNSLVVGEVALAQVLLIGGCLFFQSFLLMSEVDPGFRPQDLITTRFELYSQRYADPSARAALYREAVERVARLPGVQAVALSSTIPLDEGQLSYEFVIQGRPRPLSTTQYPSAGFDSITPGYFRTMGIPLRSGRSFTHADDGQAPRVAIINEALAKRYWSGEDPLGRKIRLHSDWPEDSEPIEIVGVVDNVRQMALNTASRPQLYLPFAQHPWRGCNLLVRSVEDLDPLVAAVRREIREIDPAIALSSFRRMDEHLSSSLASPRFDAFLLSLFAALALVLTTGGVFGVISYTTRQRTRGLAIRRALGARRRDVLRLVLGEGLLLVLAGVGLGLFLALPLTQALSSMLFGIQPFDPLTYGAVGLLLGAVALAACYVPCRQAMRVDPVSVLRQG